MKVFTEEWVQKIRTRYEKRAIPDRPAIFSFVVDERWQKQRDDIETWISILSIRDQEGLVRTIQGHTKELKQILDIYHELRFGHALIQLGYQIEYQKSLEGLTPDWFVYPRLPNEFPFILEVKTQNISDKGTSAWYELNRFLAWLKQIPIDAFLSIETKQNFVFSQKVNKQIFQMVESWLRTSPAKGAKLYLDSVNFEVIGLNTGIPHVQSLGPTDVFAINDYPLRESLKEKAKKYETINLPLVVGLIADPFTGYDIDDITNVLWGNESFSLDDNKLFRLSDGVGQELPNLSAAVWLKHSFTNPEFHIISNPDASQPLPRSIWQKSAKIV